MPGLHHATAEVRGPPHRPRARRVWGPAIPSTTEPLSPLQPANGAPGHRAADPVHLGTEQAGVPQADLEGGGRVLRALTAGGNGASSVRTTTAPSSGRRTVGTGACSAGPAASRKGVQSSLQGFTRHLVPRLHPRRYSGRHRAGLALEVLGVHLVQELPELLDLLLLVAVGDEDRGLGQHLLAREDRRVQPDRERDRVRSDGTRSRNALPFRCMLITAKNVPSRSSVITISLHLDGPSPRGMFFIRSCVIGRGVTTPCSDSAIAAASAAPIQIGR